MITPENFKKMMLALKSLRDKEVSHIEADGLMCDVLRELGYGEGVDVFESIDKWYA